MLTASSPSSSADDASDVESALLSTETTVKVKKPKRAREVEPESQPAASGKQKKRKDNDRRDGTSNQPQESHKKKKKKSKDPVGPRSDNEDDEDIDASAEAAEKALLNAIAAAVSTVTPPEATPAPPSFTHPPPLPPQHQAPAFLSLPMPFGQFPGGPGVPFAGDVLGNIPFGSNDDIIRAMQTMDPSKALSILRTQGTPADISGFAPQPPKIGPHPTPTPQSRNLPVGASTLMNLPQHTVARHVPPPPSVQRTESEKEKSHAEILCTKWLSPTKLAALVESDGLVYKKGKFSAIEEKQLQDAIEAHKQVCVCF